MVIEALLIITMLRFRDTPTPTPSPGYGVTIFQPIPSPTPVPSSTPVMLPTVFGPLDGVYNYLATAEYQLQQAPTDLLHNGSLPVLPDETGGPIFGYIKWVFSGAIADDVFGPMAPIVIHASALFALALFLAGVYFIVFVFRLIIRFVVWVVERLLSLIP